MGLWDSWDTVILQLSPGLGLDPEKVKSKVQALACICLSSQRRLFFLREPLGSRLNSCVLSDSLEFVHAMPLPQIRFHSSLSYLWLTVLLRPSLLWAPSQWH